MTPDNNYGHREEWQQTRPRPDMAAQDDDERIAPPRDTLLDVAILWTVTIAVLTAVIYLLLMMAASIARAAPPPVGSDDWQIMHPYAEWVTTQHDKRGYWCCDIGDGRPVEARIVGDHWEVHITKVHFPDEPEHWLAVPDDKIVAGGNPTGAPIVWLLHGNVQCFAPPDGV